MHKKEIAAQNAAEKTQKPTSNKKRVFQTFASSLAFILILLFLLILVSFALRPHDTVKGALQQVRPVGLLAEEENTIDVVFFGDSEAYTSISPVQMWQEHGFTGYVCATSSQYISLTASFVDEALIHQNPKLVVLETYSFFRKMKSDNAFITKLENTFSVFEYHNRWKNIIPLKNDSQTAWKDDLKGFKYTSITTGIRPKNYMEKPHKPIDIPQANIDCIKEICKKCNANGVKVIFLSTPSIKNWNISKHNTVKKLSDELGVDYIDLNLEKEIQIDWKTETADRGDHLNFKGAKKVSEFIGEHFVRNYGLKDKRNDPDFQNWNALIDTYKLLTDS